MIETKNISIKQLEVNKGQIIGLPKNPRFIRDERFEALKKSISDAPEMLSLRELIVYPSGDKFVVIAGNMRMRACKELGHKEIPCKVLDADTPVEKLKEYTIKDNVAFGNDDWDLIANEWDVDNIRDWGLELSFLDGLVKDEAEITDDDFKSAFESVTDDNCRYPIVPKFDEKHELFIIESTSEVQSNHLREILNMNKMASYKRGKISKSNIISIEDAIRAIKDCNSEL